MGNPHELIKAIAEGNRQAFEELYNLYSVNVYNTALSYTQSKEDAEEITQDVFTSINRNASGFKGEASPGTWIYRITINTSLNHLKKKKRFSFIFFGNPEPEVSHFDHPGILLENKENARLLFNAIEGLPESQKTAFILSFVEDLPRQEVADIMELSLKAVESLLQRAKANLRENLKNLYPHRRKN